MEWLEFKRMSQQVEHQLAAQAARLSEMTHEATPPAAAEDKAEQARQLGELLRGYRATNPWGHPPSEC
jgi:hypothetical protein